MSDNIYTGLILREEDLRYSEYDGGINYYMIEGEKAGYADLICSVDESMGISGQITQAGLSAEGLTSEDLSEILTYTSNYIASYDSADFYNLYSFKDRINETVQQKLYINALGEISDEAEEATSQNSFLYIYADEDGVISFYTDGYEDITPENFSADEYRPEEYQRDNLRAASSVTAGSKLYKTVSSEEWYILLPLSDDESDKYSKEMGESGSFSIKVHFLSDDTSTYASASVCEYDGEDFLLLSLNNSMVRFISDRYIDVELGSEQESGLKIPNSAIAEKDFYFVPEEYAAEGDNSSDLGVLRVNTDDKGRESVEFITFETYTQTDGGYYVSEEDISLHDRIRKPDSTDEYIVSESVTMQGVYSMNRGYAIFRLISIISQNNEYAIIRSDTPGGISIYDYIAL